MKYLSFIVLSSFVFFQACQQNTVIPTENVVSSRSADDCVEGEELALDSLPSFITDYLSNSTDLDELDEVERYDNNGTITYLIELDDLSIVLDSEGNLVASATEEDLNVADLSDEILNTIALEYPNDSILEASQELHYTGEVIIEVEISSGQELIFDQNGVLVCVGIDDGDSDDEEDEEDSSDEEDEDNDDGDDDDEVDITSLLLEIQTTLAELFPDYRIKDGELGELCGDDELLIVDLIHDADSTELELYFDLSGELLYVGTEVASESLPNVIQSIVENDYATYILEEEVLELKTTDDNIEYLLFLEATASESEDVKLLINDQGTIICEIED